MSKNCEHDYEPVNCARCGGYLGMACAICDDMNDGGEDKYVTERWCECGSKQIASFAGEEDDLYCCIHDCEKNLVDYEDGYIYECPECKREDGEVLGLR